MRRTIAAFLCALLIASSLASVSGSTHEEDPWVPVAIEDLPEERDDWWPNEAELTGAREAALEWLDEQQGPGGNIGEEYGVTGLAAFAMLNGGRTADHPVVAKALAYILSEAKEDGSFSEGTYVHYYTSLAIMALSAAGGPDNERLVSAGVDMLVREQCDGDEEGFEEWWRGGIGYGGDGRPDMSNTQFAMMALVAAEEAYPASIDVPATTWQQLLLFLHRCQNLPEINDLDWDDDVSLPSHDDGGFIYYPGRTNAPEEGQSYGSMTASGLWCLLAAGETIEDTAAGSALSWLAANFEGDRNPLLVDTGYFYYAYAAARALRTAGAAALVSEDGTQLHWARELSEGLLAKQDVTGYWMNTGADRWWEGDPVVATSFALLTIAAMMPARDSGFRVRAPDGGTIKVRDPQGRRDAEIPGWSRDADGTVTVGDASSGPFDVRVKGTDTVEVASEVDGTVKVWREVGLARDGGKMTVDVAPLMGPAQLVIANVADLPPSSSTSSTPGPGVVMALTAVVALASVTALVVRRGNRR
jgi:squalene-hopene/tetraprenyl-beta-curcumene cyclase